VATVAVEKTDGCQLYLPPSAAAPGSPFQLVTAKTSEVNVTVLPESEADDSTEHAVPEQYVSCFRDGRLVTSAAAHSGA
jgi:adenylyl cyclase-associated protein